MTLHRSERYDDVSSYTNTGGAKTTLTYDIRFGCGSLLKSVPVNEKKGNSAVYPPRSR